MATIAKNKKAHAVFVIDRTKKGGDALYEFLKHSSYAKLIKQKNEYTFDDLNETSKKAFTEADAGETYKSKNIKDLFEQLGI
jgi:hypothetical protein